MLEGVIAAAEELRSPVIIGTAEVLLYAGELKLIGPALIEAAKRATVPVVVHYDHGLTFDRCLEALKLGFTSVMFDGSAGDYEKNIADTREIVKIAHAFGATVEGEIGHVGEANANDNAATDLYTKVEEALDYATLTGVDALAVSIGTAHGAYKSKPKLDLARLNDIRNALQIPLVLHGGSGLTDDDFRKAIKEGISKVNIFTDINVAAVEAEFKKFQSMDKGLIDLIPAAVEAVKQETAKKMKLFGSDGKADGTGNVSSMDLETLTRLVAAEVAKYLNK
jgi:fructose-bisphosphate aldolase class II